MSYTVSRTPSSRTVSRTLSPRTISARTLKKRFVKTKERIFLLDTALHNQYEGLDFSYITSDVIIKITELYNYFVTLLNSPAKDILINDYRILIQKYNKTKNLKYYVILMKRIVKHIFENSKDIIITKIVRLQIFYLNAIFRSVLKKNLDILVPLQYRHEPYFYNISFLINEKYHHLTVLYVRLHILCAYLFDKSTINKPLREVIKWVNVSFNNRDANVFTFTFPKDECFFNENKRYICRSHNKINPDTFIDEGDIKDLNFEILINNIDVFIQTYKCVRDHIIDDKIKKKFIHECESYLRNCTISPLFYLLLMRNIVEHVINKQYFIKVDKTDEQFKDSLKLFYNIYMCFIIDNEKILMLDTDSYKGISCSLIMKKIPFRMITYPFSKLHNLIICMVYNTEYNFNEMIEKSFDLHYKVFFTVVHPLSKKFNKGKKYIPKDFTFKHITDIQIRFITKLYNYIKYNINDEEKQYLENYFEFKTQTYIISEDKQQWIELIIKLISYIFSSHISLRINDEFKKFISELNKLLKSVITENFEMFNPTSIVRDENIINYVVNDRHINILDSYHKINILNKILISDSSISDFTKLIFETNIRLKHDHVFDGI